WRPEATVFLANRNMPLTVQWSKAEGKPTSWRWRGANLQIAASSASPLQLGLQGGATFERISNTMRFSLSNNYLRLLNGSSREVIVIYDVGTRRAWLVPLLSVMHHMVLTYCRDIRVR